MKVFFIEPLCCFNKCVLTLVQYCWLSKLQTLHVRRVVAKPGDALLAVDCETKLEPWVVVVVAGGMQLGVACQSYWYYGLLIAQILRNVGE
jgi:hypothetical protein